MTPEIREQVIQEYLAGIPIIEIAAKYHIHKTTPGRIAKEAGYPGRRQKIANERKCKNCRMKINVKGARFCPFCGADLRTESEILVEKLENTTRLFRFLPENCRDDFIGTINKAIKMLQER